MKKLNFPLLLSLVCLVSPVAAVILFKNGYHGNGYTNKGEIFKNYVYNKKLKKSLWNIMCEKKHCLKKLDQVKQALGHDGIKVNVVMSPVRYKGYNAIIGDPKGYMIIGYKMQDWQESIFKDLKHLIKVN